MGCACKTNKRNGENTLESIHHLHFVGHWSILVSAIIQWAIGAIWYSPVLFAKQWAALVSTPSGPDKQKSMIIGMICSFGGSVVLSGILWHVIAWSGANTWGSGSFVGFLCWGGFFAAPQVGQYIFEGRRFKLFAINSSYWLFALLVTGGLLAVWK
jgi:hypothetical protein